ncbi:hypothetical protein [Nocardioides panacisoli]|uniref:alpha/beta hydrolase family esterase n=1 Tax=Nocardioides panacisoli TaxID=627624 RepID=UPI0031D09BBE
MGSAECADVLAKPRTVIFFLHGAGGLEDPATSAYWLGAFHAIAPDAILVYGISKDGSRRWDAGVCCTTAPVDDVGYLAEVVDDLAASWSIARARVGALGVSNGGMLALRATCERPDLVTAVAALSATYDGACDRGKVRVAQWHGALDTVVPLDGGAVPLYGAVRNFPPVASIAKRMTAGSVFVVSILPGRSHAMTWAEYRPAMLWLLGVLR